MYISLKRAVFNIFITSFILFIILFKRDNTWFCIKKPPDANLDIPGWQIYDSTKLSLLLSVKQWQIEGLLTKHLSHFFGFPYIAKRSIIHNWQIFDLLVMDVWESLISLTSLRDVREIKNSQRESLKCYVNKSWPGWSKAKTFLRNVMDRSKSLLTDKSITKFRFDA